MLKDIRMFLLKKTRKLAVEFFNRDIYDGKLRIYLTLRCNYDCPYCVDNYRKPDFDGYAYKIRSVEEWATKINELRRDVVFTGGEPFLYKHEGLGLVDLINRLHKSVHVSIYSNIGIDLSEQIAKLKRPVKMLISFHSYEAKIPIFMKNIDAVNSHSKIDFRVHIVDAGDNVEQPNVKELRDEMNKRNLPVLIEGDQDFEGSRRQFRLRAKCSRKIVLLAPDGTRFQCVGKLTRRADHLENIFDDGLKQDLNVVDCHEYGFCSACDWMGETKIEVVDKIPIIPSVRDYQHKTYNIKEVELHKKSNVTT